jgi:Protein of unknown function (DUF4199)/TgpA N-terminal domain/ATP synthase j chain
MEPKVTSSIAKGVMISLVLLAISIAGQLLNLDTQSWFRWLSTLILLASIITSCIVYSNQNENNVTFGNIFAEGFKTTAVITCLTIVFTVIMFLLMPELKQRFFDIAAQEAEKSGASDDIIEKQQALVKKMFWVFIIGGIMVTYLIVGVISSLIGAAAAKKNPRDPFQQPA